LTEAGGFCTKALMAPLAILVGVVGLCGFLAGSPATAQSRARDFGVSPWSEAEVIVKELDASASLLIEVGGWHETARGRLDRSELDYWNLPKNAQGRFLRICAPRAQSGCIRYVALEGVVQRPIRLAARPWDTGGIFSLMLRSDDAAALFKAAVDRGWWAESEPYSFSFGGSDLINVVLQGPHGVNYAIYQRLNPRFEGFAVGRLSLAFNSMRMVRDQRKSLAFYRDTLGFAVLFDAPYVDPRPVANNFSVPTNLATKLVRRAAALQPELPGETGRVEVMQFEGFEGRDLAAHASPPNLGIVSLRFPVRDLAGYRRFVERRGGTIVYDGKSVSIGGLGRVDLFAVRDPDGNLSEFYHVL